MALFAIMFVIKTIHLGFQFKNGALQSCWAKTKAIGAVAMAAVWTGVNYYYGVTSQATVDSWTGQPWDISFPKFGHAWAILFSAFFVAVAFSPAILNVILKATKPCCTERADTVM